MITSERFCISYDLLNAILLPSKFVYFSENLHCCHRHCHDFTCSCRRCYVMCGHNIIYDMTLSTDRLSSAHQQKSREKVGIKNLEKVVKK